MYRNVINNDFSPCIWHVSQSICFFGGNYWRVVWLYNTKRNRPIWWVDFECFFRFILTVLHSPAHGESFHFVYFSFRMIFWFVSNCFELFRFYGLISWIFHFTPFTKLDLDFDLMLVKSETTQFKVSHVTRVFELPSLYESLYSWDEKWQTKLFYSFNSDNCGHDGRAKTHLSGSLRRREYRVRFFPTIGSLVVTLSPKQWVPTPICSKTASDD